MDGKAPSFDSILKFIQTQAFCSEQYTSVNVIVYQFNKHEHLSWKSKFKEA